MEQGSSKTMLFVALVSLVLAVIPALMHWVNHPQFRLATTDEEILGKARSYSVSVLIPARNEQASIAASLESILASSHPRLEILVMDDHSQDETAMIVERMSLKDQRIRGFQSSALPSGWNGKQHACWQLASLATSEYLLFLDADVRLTRDGITRCVAQQLQSRVPLLSGFPKQELGTWSEQCLIPMMYHLLLGYLPIARMRNHLDPGLAAGCGQLFLADPATYFQVDGHRSIHGSRHDGIQLPRTFRRQGHSTDIFDASDLACCRMYKNAGEVTRGLLKNATEGVGHPKLIPIFSVLLIGGWVLPFVGFGLAIAIQSSLASKFFFTVAAILGWAVSYANAKRFGVSWMAAIMHPLNVTAFILLQWVALLLSLMGKQVKWRGRG